MLLIIVVNFLNLLNKLFVFHVIRIPCANAFHSIIAVSCNLIVLSDMAQPISQFRCQRVKVNSFL